MNKSEERSCSFCGKKETEVLKLVAGPHVYICNECVILASYIINPSPDDTNPPVAQPSSTYDIEEKKELSVNQDKENFSIEEVCEIVGVRPHIIRYWETEFLQVKPERNEFNQRIYSRKDLDIIIRISFLLFEERYTIQNTKNQLDKEFGF